MNGLQSLLSHPAVMRLGWALVHFLWQGAAIAALLALTLLLLRRATASARYLAACGALLLMTAAPVFTYWHLAPLPGSPQGTLAELPELPDIAPSGNVAVFTPVPDPSGAYVSVKPLLVPPQAAPPPWHVRAMHWIEANLRWIVGAWFFGVLCLSIRLLIGWIGVRQIRRSGVGTSETLQNRLKDIARRLSVARPVRLLTSAIAGAPVVIGWFRPVILFPASFLTQLSPQHLEAILAHELAHVRRHDYLVNLFQTVVETLLFYHPAVHWVSHRMRVEREHCCDDLAVTACGDSASYARALARLAEMSVAAPGLVPGAGGQLLGRIRRLLSADVRQGSRVSVWVGGAVLVTALLVCAITLGASKRDLSQAKPGPASAFRLVELSDCDPDYHKQVANDTLTVYGSDGQVVWKIGGINTCQTVGGNHEVAWNPVDRSLWLVELVGHRLLKVSPSGTLAMEKPGFDAQALAADPKSGDMWVLTTTGTILGKETLVVAPTGEVLRRYPIGAFDLTYSAHDDCFWLVGKRVTKLNRDGKVLFTSNKEFPWLAVSVAVNERDGTVCVLERANPDIKESKNQLHLLAADGGSRETIPLKVTDGAVFSVAVDSDRECIWLASTDGLLQLGMNGKILNKVPFEAYSVCVEPDTGCVWAGGKGGLCRVASDGQFLWQRKTDVSFDKWLCMMPDLKLEGKGALDATTITGQPAQTPQELQTEAVLAQKTRGVSMPEGATLEDYMKTVKDNFPGFNYLIDQASSITPKLSSVQIPDLSAVLYKRALTIRQILTAVLNSVKVVDPRNIPPGEPLSPTFIVTSDGYIFISSPGGCRAKITSPAPTEKPKEADPQPGSKYSPEQVAAMYRTKYGQDLSPAELAKFYAKQAIDLSQTGPDPAVLADTAELALALDEDDLTRLRLYVILGDAYWLQTRKFTPEIWGRQRRIAAEAYFLGLRDVLRNHLPAAPPELPAVGLYTVGGPPAEIEKYRKIQQQEIAARKEAERIGALVRLRQTLTGQIIQMYARDPDAFEELRGLALKYVGSEKAASDMVNAAKEYRNNWKIPIPAIEGNVRDKASAPPAEKPEEAQPQSGSFPAPAEKPKETVQPTSSELGIVLVSLDAPSLEEGAVQFAVFETDPVPGFKARLLRSRLVIESMLKNSRTTITETHGETERTIDIKRNGPIRTEWDSSFAKVTGSDVHLLTSSQIKAGLTRSVAFSSTTTTKWLVTKAGLILSAGKTVCWCIPFRATSGGTEIVMNEKNALYLDPIFDEVMSAPAKTPEPQPSALVEKPSPATSAGSQRADAHEQAVGEIKDINAKVARMNMEDATVTDVIAVFGEPTSFVWGDRKYTKDKLPQDYLMVYSKAFSVFMSMGQIQELRFEDGSEYAFHGKLRVGSTLDEALKVIGPPDRTVEGGLIADGYGILWEDGVLYKDAENPENGEKGLSCYARRSQGIRIFAAHNVVRALYVTRKSPSPLKLGGGTELTVGLVVDEAGKPLADVHVSVDLSGRGKAIIGDSVGVCVTWRDGRFAFKLPKGAVDIRAAKQGYMSKTSNFSTGSTNLKIVLTKGQAAPAEKPK